MKETCFCIEVEQDENYNALIEIYNGLYLLGFIRRFFKYGVWENNQ